MTKMMALDWRAMKTYQIRFWLLPAALILIGWMYPIAVIPISVFLSLGFSVNPFAVEEKGALNNLYLTLAVNRKSIVLGRYALSSLMLFGGIIMGLILMPLANTISLSKWYVGFEGYMALITFSYLLYSLLNLIMFPVLFGIGYLRGKIGGFYLPTLFFCVLCGVYTSLSALPGNGGMTIGFISYASQNMLLISGGMTVVATALLLASYTLSLHLYSKRDF